MAKQDDELSVQKAMPQSLSLFLDLVRFLAACAVVLSHLLGGDFTQPPRAGVAGLGVFSVGVFFALSGFVIEYTISKSQPSFNEYLLARLSRIYSVLIPGLLITYLLLFFGANVFPKAYAAYGYSSSSFDLRPTAIAQQWFSCLTFLNESPWLRGAPPTNGAIWSLGYEVPYYLWFALLVYAPKWVRLVGTLAAILLWGSAVAVLFPAWMAGVGLFRALAKTGVSKTVGVLCLICAPIAMIATEKSNAVWLRPHPDSKLFSLVDQAANHRSSGWPLLYGGAITMIFLVLAASAFEAELLGALIPFKKLIRSVSSATFSIYLYHFPILCLLCALPFYRADRTIDAALVFVATLALSYLLSLVTESKKKWWHHQLSRAILRRA